MSFPFSLMPALEHIKDPYFPFYYFTQQQLQPTTVLVSNCPPPSPDYEHELKNKKNTKTEDSIRSRSISPPAKRAKIEPRVESKQIKRIIPKKKDENFGSRNQNKSRNLLSSILKGYVQYILHSRGMVRLIEQFSKKLGLDNGVSRFYDFMARTFPSKKSYVGIQYMQAAMANRQKEPQMALVLSVTLRHYLTDVYLLNLYQGSKLKKKVRLSMLKKSRQIFSMLFSQ